MAKKKKTEEEKPFVPSKYQEAIFDFIRNGHGNAVIEAVAGSGKTTTALKCLELINPEDKVLLTAFNTDIVEELKKKIKKLPNKNNIDCRTMHSLGYTMLMSNFPRQIDPKPNDFKYSGYVYNNIEMLSEGFYETLKGKDRSKYIDNIKNLVDFGRYYLCENLSDMKFIESHYKIPVYGDEKEVALKVMEWGKDNIETIDFTDMVWLPNVLNCKPYGRLYDWIVCDECQDTMTAERMLLLRCTKMSTRMLFFGEKIQCQPEGTKILMSDGSQKDIKDIQVGDEVVTYSIRKSTYSGFKPVLFENRYPVTGVESHMEKRFIRVTLNNGMNTEYTPEHICLAKFNFGKHSKVWGIALMENDMGMFFIGRALLYSNKIHHGLLWTLRPEHCTRGWVLKVLFDEDEAKLEQIRLSHMYNIPLAPSMLFGEEKNEEIIKNVLSSLYDGIGWHIITENAINCLSDFNRILQYPISDAHNEVPHARTMLHAVRACNLIPELMELSYFDEKQKSHKVKDSYRYAASTIKDIEYFDEDKMVYSLEVAKNHTYVADGIATHNCIYSFMGSDYRSFDELRKLPNTISLPLSISYRCSKNVVQTARRFNGRIEPMDGAPEGSVTYDANIKDIQDGDMVLCRNNAPLLQLYCELAKLGKPAYIRGKDVGASLIKVIDRTKNTKLNRDLKQKGVFGKLYDNLINEIDTVMNKHHITFEMAMDDSDVSQMYDTIQALSVISIGLDTADELKEKIKGLFSDKKMKGISLSTIHKAKGLEADNVFICCPSLMPAKSAKEPWELQQESNLEYVAYTRAKNNLSFLNEDDFKDYASNSQQKAHEVQKIMHKVFNLYGNNQRCMLDKPSPEAAKVILENKTEIPVQRGKAVDLNNRKKSKNKKGQIVLPRKKKRR